MVLSWMYLFDAGGFLDEFVGRAALGGGFEHEQHSVALVREQQDVRVGHGAEEDGCHQVQTQLLHLRH